MFDPVEICEETEMQRRGFVTKSDFVWGCEARHADLNQLAGGMMRQMCILTVMSIAGLAEGKLSDCFPDQVSVNW